MATILVTGGSGYIGSHTIIDLIQNGFEVVSIDSGINSHVKMIDIVSQIVNKPIKHYNVDLCRLEDTRKVFANHKFDGVIHFAALKAVGESTEKPIEYFQNNNNSLLNILECMEEFDVDNLIYSSSCTVYGDNTISPVKEDNPLGPAASPYGRTKQIGEQMIDDVMRFKGGKSILLRYFNPAGAHTSGLLGEYPKVKALNLVPSITETAIGKRDQLLVFGDDYDTRDGSCIRDYIHVMDLASAHTLAVKRLIEGSQEEHVDIFNLGIGEGVSVLEMIKAFEATSNQSLNYKIVERRPGDVVSIFANYTKAQKILGWTPKYNVEDIMRTAWEWEKNKLNLN